MYKTKYLARLACVSVWLCDRQSSGSSTNKLVCAGGMALHVWTMVTMVVLAVHVCVCMSVCVCLCLYLCVKGEQMYAIYSLVLADTVCGKSKGT